MQPNFEMFPTLANPAIGEPFEYRAEMLNIWRAEQLDMFVTLDISNAPSLQFVGGQDPFLGNTTAGTIVIDATGGPTTFTQPQRGNAQIDIPAGATAAKIQLIPASGGPTGPDLTMRVYDARTALSEEPSVIINDVGAGGTEVYAIDGAATVGGHGFGTWVIQAEVRTAAVGTNPVIDPQVSNIDFTVVVDTWFNTTGQTQQVLNKAGPLAKGAREIFTWQLMMTQEPTAGETIEVIGNATTFYLHQPGVDENHWNFTENATAPVQLVDGSISMGLEPQEFIINAPQATKVSMAAISEAIGYAATFLLLASIFTGGMFGKATRRWQNQIFGSARRRVAFHNFLSYGIIAAAFAHMTIFVIDAIEPNYPWQLGLIWGGLGNLCLLALGVTGAVQVPMIRKWNYATWRWTHFALSIGAIVFTIVHMLLDGQNFGAVQDFLNYTDPLVPSDRA